MAQIKYVPKKNVFVSISFEENTLLKKMIK